jgi:1-acyl-sn-glycerol-3-phosphate acyltransferase
MNFFLTKSLLAVGARCHFQNEVALPVDRPLLMVANHNSLYDIPPLYWYLRKHHVKFVSKIELGKGIPSVSFNLRHGGSVLIDRKDQKQSFRALMDFGKYLEKNKYACVIFPEGTRGKKGRLQNFSRGGIKILLKSMPTALIVPVAIKNTWLLNKHGKYPMSFGEKLSWTTLKPLDPTEFTADELISLIEERIRDKVLSGSSHNES